MYPRSVRKIMLLDKVLQFQDKSGHQNLAQEEQL